tara:strand:- start:3923 stop:4174 length:252 start_codon:yes stop_codon:yes gene_type:complete
MSQTPHGVKNPINKVPMIDSPKDWGEIHDYIERFTTEDRAFATVIAGMVWNLAHEQVEELIKTENKFFDRLHIGDDIQQELDE